MSKSKFVSTHNKGFQMTFENGFRISVQWGIGNYCQRKEDGDFGDPRKTEFWESLSAEIAVFNTNNKMQENSSVGMLSLGRDTVEGWVSADQVAKVIAIVQSSKTTEEIQQKYKALNI